MYKIIICVGIIAIALVAPVMVTGAADEKKAETVSGLVKPPPIPPQRLAVRSIRPSVPVVLGSITRIDRSDPANITIDVKNDKDGTLNTFEIMPWTSITKITGINELKVGERVRVTSRNMDDRKAAMGIMFGDLKETTGPGPIFGGPVLKRPAPHPSTVQKKAKE